MAAAGTGAALDGGSGWPLFYFEFMVFAEVARYNLLKNMYLKIKIIKY
jgi:hypothetical protein